MANAYDRLGYQDCVGKVICGLFPNGFDVKQYKSILDNYLSKLEGVDDGVKSEIIESIDEYEQQISDGVLSSLDKRRLKEKVVNGESTYVSKTGFEISTQKFSSLYTPVPYTPFDLFAVAAVLLKKSGAYHHIETTDDEVAYREDHTWSSKRVIFVTPDQRLSNSNIADRWRASNGQRRPITEYEASEDAKGLPIELVELWSKLLSHWNEPVFRPMDRKSQAPEWWSIACKLLMIADRAARNTGFRKASDLSSQPMGFWAGLADTIFEEEGAEGGSVHTLSAAARDSVSILPKARAAQIGVTLRSLSHNLALLPARGSVRATWDWQYQQSDQLKDTERRAFNLLIVPYPYEISISCFEPTSVAKAGKKSGRFKYSSKCGKKLEDGSEIRKIDDFLKRIHELTKEQVGTVHGVVLPELSLTALEFQNVVEYFDKKTNIELLCCGLRERYPDNAEDMNDEKWVPEPANQCVMFSFSRRPNGVPNDRGVERPKQICKYEKHHRWKLNGTQIKDYGLSPVLDPAFDWWEDTHILNRKLPFLVMRDQWVVTTLICEDLARIDPAQEMVRAIGPNLVIALLMDGPQISNRWSARYATVLADDPGSAVLTVNSLGLINRSNNVRATEQKETEMSRSIALWRDDTGLTKEISLPEGHHAVCLTFSEHSITEQSLDGRVNNEGSVALRFANFTPIQWSK